MKIKDFDRNFLNYLSKIPQAEMFIENYQVPNVNMDLESINVALSNIVLDNLNSLDEKLLTGDDYAWGSKISFSTNKISNISKSLSLVNVAGKPASLKEYYFWKKMDDIDATGSNTKSNIFINHLKDHCYDYSSSSYVIGDDSIKELLLGLVLHINDLREHESNHSKIELIKAYLYPAIDSNIDFLSILKELEKDGKDIDLFRVWERSALKNSRDPKLFKYLFGKIKRSSGYVQRKMEVIRTAFSNNAVDKDLFKLFIKKSTITIRRELAETFASKQIFVLRVRNITDKIISHLELELGEDKEREKEFSMSYFYRKLPPLLESELSILSYEDFIMESNEDKLAYIKEIDLFLTKESELAQSGLIYISEEKDYQVQRKVVDYITKENSVWVLPNISDSYCRRILNNKIIGD